MQHRSSYFSHICLLLAFGALFMSSCKTKEYALPTPSDKLQNEAIKRTLGPNIVKDTIEFAYAMAILPSKGKLVSCVAEASIAGAPGTYMENRSFYTNQSGQDVGITVGTPSDTKGTITTVTYNHDTSAATLRYYYVIPEEARSKAVTIKFTATSSDGESISTTMGPYTISKMDRVLNMRVSDNNLAYISIADTTVYTAANAAAHAASIDLVYLYRNISTSAFGHALVSPAADTQYLPGITLPTGVNRGTKLIKTFNLQDFNLAHEQYGIYIDDVDFQQMDFSAAPNFAINLKAEAGVWVETADKKYRAYIFLNGVSASGFATISIKRYAL